MIKSEDKTFYGKYKPEPESKYADFLSKFESVKVVNQEGQSYPCQLDWFQYSCVHDAIREYSRDTVDKRSLKATLFCLLAKIIDKVRNSDRTDWPIAYMPYVACESVTYPKEMKKLIYEWKEGGKRYVAYVR